MAIQIPLDEMIQQIQTCLHNEKWSEAEHLINQALGQHPEDPVLLFYAGNLFANSGRYGLAIPILNMVCAHHPDLYEAWANLGGAYRREHKVPQAREALQRAVEIRDTDSNVYGNLAACYVNEGDPEDGERFARRAIELNKNNTLASWNLSLILLEQAKWAEGFERYAQGENTKQRLYRTYEADRKTPVLFDLENLQDDQTVVVHGEQGLGDEVMFMSILPDFIEYRKTQALDRGLTKDEAHLDTRIIIECHGRLEGVLRRSFPNIEVNGTRDKEFLAWASDREVHWSCPIGNLGKFFRKQDSDFMDHKGYLTTDAELTKTYRRQLELTSKGRPIIGFAWTGGVKSTQAEYRSLNMPELLPILGQDAFFVSMQYMDDEADVDDLELYAGVRLERFPQAAQAKSTDKICALANACDLVITVNNSLHHLCGGIGKECWTMTPKGCAWRYAPTSWDHAIWYPHTSRMFRQGDDRQWGPVINNVAEALTVWLQQRETI